MVKPAETLAGDRQNTKAGQEINGDVNNHIAGHHLQTKH